ncbi:hypothetical protein RF11_12942 [Thelohanellus kitauei]|uniref:Sortilin C-terminal domain-containing protein n=1 Tax=Thelohanellus kitauei TaxID=669202 RepID=A0A0C2NM92_THEKT|nr:hypothetical protein RF11_12942 [Thelohanellus kitauei]
MLNFGMVILSVDMDTNYINYSSDEAVTWNPYEIFTNKPKILYMGRFTETSQKALIVAKETKTNEILFKIVDLSQTFSFYSTYTDNDCGKNDYHSWELPISDGFCHLGHGYKMMTRQPQSHCVDTMKWHVVEILKCKCTPDFFGWYTVL